MSASGILIDIRILSKRHADVYDIFRSSHAYVYLIKISITISSVEGNYSYN